MFICFQNGKSKNCLAGFTELYKLKGHCILIYVMKKPRGRRFWIFSSWILSILIRRVVDWIVIGTAIMENSAKFSSSPAFAPFICVLCAHLILSAIHVDVILFMWMSYVWLRKNADLGMILFSRLPLKFLNKMKSNWTIALI